jgi:hypothetical protein
MFPTEGNHTIHFFIFIYFYPQIQKSPSKSHFLKLSTVIVDILLELMSASDTVTYSKNEDAMMANHPRTA